jgi:hypothetical protein
MLYVPSFYPVTQEFFMPPFPDLPTATNDNDPAPPAGLAVVPAAGRPLVPECSAFLEGGEPVADKVEAFLAGALAATSGPQLAARALVPWMCDVLLSEHSLKAYGTVISRILGSFYFVY